MANHEIIGITAWAKSEYSSVDRMRQLRHQGKRLLVKTRLVKIRLVHRVPGEKEDVDTLDFTQQRPSPGQCALFHKVLTKRGAEKVAATYQLLRGKFGELIVHCCGFTRPKYNGTVFMANHDVTRAQIGCVHIPVPDAAWPTSPRSKLIHRELCSQYYARQAFDSLRFD